MNRAGMIRAEGDIVRECVILDASGQRWSLTVDDHGMPIRFENREDAERAATIAIATAVGEGRSFLHTFEVRETLRYVAAGSAAKWGAGADGRRA